MDFGTTYYWRVEARDCECTGWQTYVSPTHSFTTRDEFEARQLEGGDYSFGYFLFDSQTGRQSALSEVAQARQEEFVVGADPDADPPVEGTPADTFVAMEIVYDSSKYDKAYIFRSVRVQDAGGTFIAGILQLDDIVDLAEIQTINNGSGTPFPDTQDFRQSVYYYKLEDKQLVFQDVFTEQTLFDDRMPSGGAATVYNELMIVSSIENDEASSTEEDRPGDPITSLGEIRWSSSRVKNPELFPPLNRFVPAIPTNEVIRFLKLGGNAIGFSQDRMYHLRLLGRVLQPTEMHEGYGLVNRKAVDAVSSMAMFVTPKGLKSVGSFGKLDDVRVWDDLLIDRWKSDLKDISLAFDPAMSTLFMLNPTQEEAACMWMTTAMATELRDMTFSEVRQGNWPDDPTDFDDNLVERALWLQNSPKDTATEVIVDWKPRVFVVDYRRERVIANDLATTYTGTPRYRLMDINADAIFKLEAVSGGVMSLLMASGNVDATGAYNFYAYMLECPDDRSLEGTKIKIKRYDALSAITHDFDIATADAALWAGITDFTGVYVALSPIYFNWIGHNLPLRDETGTTFGGIDYTRPRQVDALGASFTDVRSPSPIGSTAPDTVVRWRGLVFEGSGDTPKDKAFPTLTSGGLVRSITDGEATYWAGFGEDPNDVLTGKYGVHGVTLSPGLEIFVPDVDYRLLSVLVGGNVQAGQRTERPT
jgi:hypothetical protein